MKDLFLLTDGKDRFDILEKLFSVPPEQREALLAEIYKAKKLEYLGSTALSAPELAIECIKKGIVAKSWAVADKTVYKIKKDK